VTKVHKFVTFCILGYCAALVLLPIAERSMLAYIICCGIAGALLSILLASIKTTRR
jgi:hypothetical protein